MAKNDDVARGGKAVKRERPHWQWDFETRCESLIVGFSHRVSKSHLPRLKRSNAEYEWDF